MVQKTAKIWMDGEMIPWEDAQVHVLTHSLHYGLAVFEGIRCYKGAGGSAVFRLKDHLRRLFHSAHIANMKIPFPFETIFEACREIMRVNRLAEGYIRPLVFIGDGGMGLYAVDNPIRVIVAAWPWGTYLGEEGLRNGIRLKTSSYTRHHVNSMFVRAKISGNYVNSIMAKREALAGGYEEALILDDRGFVSEASGENIFAYRNGELVSPPLHSVLNGITRDAVIHLARDFGIPFRECSLTRDDLYIAEEVFLTGTAAEVTPIREIDDRTIGQGRRGPVTERLQSAFFALVRGENRKYAEWLTPIA
ncbi:MAG: branched-chain amino acid transaminase [Deltaproteobacteria bacterium]|nr:MAG: branched-chain amino acid transaminase [Deltaproteobacteria bacterium]